MVRTAPAKGSAARAGMLAIAPSEIFQTERALQHLGQARVADHLAAVK